MCGPRPSRGLPLWTALHGTVMLRMLRPLMEVAEPDAQVDDLVDRLLGLHG